jgi:hypothetical protein
MAVKRYLLPASLSLLGICSAFALGAYHRNVRVGESYHQFYSFPKGGARPVVLRYGQDGILHKLFSRHALAGSLGLTNTGKPVKVRLELDKVPEGLVVHWDDSHTGDFNLESRTVERILNTGDSISVHHTYYIGSQLRGKAVVYDGGLKILDALTGKRLLFIPIRILNSKGANQEMPEDCHAM